MRDVYRPPVVHADAPPVGAEFLREIADLVESPDWDEFDARTRNAVLHKVRERLAARPERDNLWPLTQYRHGEDAYLAAFRFHMALARVIETEPPGDWAGKRNTKDYQQAKRVELVAGLRQVAEMIT